MTPEQAINILDNAVGTINTNRAIHVELAGAVGVIREALIELEILTPKVTNRNIVAREVVADEVGDNVEPIDQSDDIDSVEE